ncbi:type II secretion system protein [Pseudomonas aeruginosa]|nr:type II secretion system protein [Pseudomonas aeruginosa]
MHRSTGIGVSRWLGGLLGVALALPALALPQGCIELLAQAPRVDVVQGQQRDLRLAVPIERLAIGDPKIADVQLLDRRGFPGHRQGTGLHQPADLDRLQSRAVAQPGGGRGTR